MMKAFLVFSVLTMIQIIIMIFRFRIKKNDRFIAKITALSTIKAKNILKDRPTAYPMNLYVCAYSKMLSTKILKQAANLVKKSVDFVREIVYAKNHIPSSNLPMYIITDFGDMYTDQKFFSNNSSKHLCVPIKSTTTTWYMYNSNIYREHFCTHIPLKKSWGWTA